MSHFKYLYETRHRLIKLGLPALVSRATLAIWGVLTIFIIRSLPPEAYAIYAVAKSLEMFGVLLGGGFIQQAILKLASEGDGLREKQLANSGILMALCFSVISAVLLLGGGRIIGSFYEPLDLTGIPLLLAAVVVTGTLNGLPRLLLLTRHRTRDVMISDIVQFITKSVIIGILLLTGTLKTAHQIFTAMIIANIVSFFVCAWIARHLFSPSAGVGVGRIPTVMRFSVIFLGASMANFIYTRTDILMLGKIAPDDVAAYGASRSLSGLTLMVISAANMILLPFISRIWSQGRKEEILPRVWSTILLAEILILPFVFLYVFFPRQVLDFVYSGKYSENWSILLILGALAIARPLGSFFATTASAIGKPQYALYSVIVSAVVNVGLNIYLIPVYGGFGAALATSAAVILGAAWVVLATTRHIRSSG
ncbi:MAG: oligosaccharide flippase family protein [Candidatus Fermentibacteria bacterium]